MIGFAFQLVKDDQLAQDIVQEAFMRLQQMQAEVSVPRGWLYSTVRHLSIDHLRRSSKIVAFSARSRDGETHHQEPEQTDPSRSPSEAAEFYEQTGLMRVCIERLEPSTRTLIELKFIENLSYKQIAQRLSITASNVGYRLHHALKALEVELRKEGIAHYE